MHDAPRIARLARALAHDVAAVDAVVSTYGASRMLANDEVEGQAPGHSEFAWRNAAGHLACNKPYHCFSRICCATILQYQNTTFISWQQMFLNAETLSMIPGFVREINRAFLWEGIRNGKHAVPAPGSAAGAYTLLDRRRLQVRFPVMARLNWWQTILAAVVASLVAIVVTMLVGWQYTQSIAA